MRPAPRWRGHFPAAVERENARVQHLASNPGRVSLDFIDERN